MPSYAPHAKQAAAHKAFLVDGFDRGAMFWGRQVGKSLWSVKHLEMAACFKQGQYFIVFNTHKHAKDVMWRQYLNVIPRELIADTNATDLTITFKYIKGSFRFPGIGVVEVEHDTTLAPSSIQLLGSDYADDHRGRKANGIIFDEYQDQDPGNWDAVYEPFFSTTRGWAVFMGTPKGYNHWYDLLEYAKSEKNKRWFYSEATWRDNPAISEEFVREAKEDAEARGTLDTFLQEYELQFRTVYGSVYPSFDRQVHVLKQTDRRIPPYGEGTLYGVWDFGFAEGHPMAFNLVVIDNQGRWFVTDEIHGTGIDMESMIENIRIKLGDRKVTGIVADSARPDLIDLARSKGLPIIPAPKHQNSVTSGIILLQAKIKPRLQLLGLPEPELYITENCRRTIYQVENYRYKEHVKDRPQQENPLKIDDDHPDALRYLALWLKYGVNTQTTPIKNSFQSRQNKFGLLK